MCVLYEEWENHAKNRGEQMKAEKLKDITVS